MKTTRNKQQRRRSGWILALIFLAVLLVIFSLGKRGFIRQVQLEQSTENLRKEIRQEKEEITRLEKEKEDLATPEYQEKVAREEYGMAKKDEKILYVVPEEKK
ncbi:septum formation initiator family protein [bacterium]|nr:septum formation initiator family protein [bacterium]